MTKGPPTVEIRLTMLLSIRLSVAAATLLLVGHQAAEAAVPEVLPSRGSPAALEVIPVRDLDHIREARKAAEEDRRIARDLLESAKSSEALAKQDREVSKETIETLRARVKRAKKAEDDAEVERLDVELELHEAREKVLARIVSMRASEIDWLKEQEDARELEIDLARAEEGLAELRAELDALYAAELDAKTGERILKLEERLWDERKDYLELAKKHARALQDSAKRRRDLVNDRLDILKEQKKLLEQEKRAAS